MQESKSRELCAFKAPGSLATAGPPPIIAVAGCTAAFAWDEFFAGQISNEHTRTAYLRAVRRFLAWCEEHELPLKKIEPGHVGRYFSEFRSSIPTKKLAMSAIRGLFDVLVLRHVVILNPALSVRTERYSAVEGRTPLITVEQASRLLASIHGDAIVDFRDRAVLATLIYTAARAGAVAGLQHCNFVDEGSQYVLHFAEKGGKARTIPVQHRLQKILKDYWQAAAFNSAEHDGPLFGTLHRKKRKLTDRPMSGIDICRMVKRRLKAAGLPTGISPHSFRSCVATDLLSQSTPLEDVQYLLGHSDARTTRLYDRRQKQVTRSIVEKISVTPDQNLTNFASSEEQSLADW